MDKHFICLANSYKRGGRCIAGIVVSIDSNDHWVTETLSNGSPKWIRPINRNTEYGEIPENEARFISLLSIVRLTDIEPCPSQSHAEDVYYQQILAVGIIQPTTEILDKIRQNKCTLKGKTEQTKKYKTSSKTKIKIKLGYENKPQKTF